ncbi:MAG: hypothetical protein JRI68_02525 [Deltaproteobacteria bacterium]|nr:hypothetical protein [Deltaproteobacteria bacterium]
MGWLATAGQGCADDETTQEPTPQPDAGVDADADVPQTRAPHALILDGELSHFSSWVDVLTACDEAQIPATYRRFYPHLTAADVTPTDDEHPYEVIVMAAGRSPGNPTSLARFDEIENAIGFVEQGGALVLVTQHGWQDSPSGENDFFIQNRILERLSVPVRVERNTVIGDAWVGDPAPPHEPEDWSYPTPLEFQLGYPYLLTPDEETVAGGSAPTLAVASTDVQVLLRTHSQGYIWGWLQGSNTVVGLGEERAMATLAPAGEGYVAVVPRGAFLLSAGTGQLSDKPAMDLASRLANRQWMAGLIDQLHGLVTRADELAINETLGTDELFSVGAPNEPPLDPDGEVIEIAAAVSTRAVPAAPPAGELNEQVPPTPTEPRPLPTWLTPYGGRLAYGSLTPDQAGMATAFDEIVNHNVDVLMTSTDPSLLATLTGTALSDEQAKYVAIAAMAETAGATWIVGDWFNSAAGDYPPMVGAHGFATDVPAPLHEAYWTDVVIPIYTAVGELAASNPGLGGLHLDLELYNGPVAHHDGWAFSDDTIEFYLAGLSNQTLADDLRAADPADRLDRLVDEGVLGDYFTALEAAAYDLGRRCREAAHDSAPDLELMVYTAGFPNTWFYRGLLRGLGTHDKPVTVLTYEGWGDRMTDALYAEGIDVAHLGGTIVSHWLPDDFTRVLLSLATGNDGYWYFTFNDFSSTNPTPPDLHGTAAEYWYALDEANGLLP